jgi:hypothetical protein
VLALIQLQIDMVHWHKIIQSHDKGSSAYWNVTSLNSHSIRYTYILELFENNSVCFFFEIVKCGKLDFLNLFVTEDFACWGT